MSKIDFLWKLENVSVQGLRKKRLNNLNCELYEGITAVTGWSGAGKSTLIQLLSGQITADSGTVTTAVHNNSNTVPLYIVPQDFGLWPQISVFDHVYKCMPQPDKTKAQKLLKDFDLNHKADDSIDLLSQGECSRLAVARAMATEARVILMDEPLANVDSSRKMRYWNEIIKFVKTNNSSIIFSTHIAQEVIAYADQVLCLHEGSLEDSGNAEEIYRNPKNETIAALFGPGNWIEGEEFAGDRLFCRPEEISITVSEQGESTVSKSEFFGQYTMTVLTSGRTLFHCSPRALTEGVKVIISLFIVLCFFSCKPQSESTLLFSNVSSWNMPASGQILPGPRAVSPGLNGEIIVLDDAGRILIYDEDGKEKKRWKMPETELGHPEGAVVLSNGNIAVADTHYARVVVFDKDGKVDNIFGTRGTEEGQFYSPVGITIDDKENIYVCEYGKNDRIQKFTKEGKFIKSFGTVGIENGQLQRASDLIWFKGQIFVADAVNNRIQIFSDEGDFIKVFADSESGLYMPYDIDMSQDGYFYIAEYGHSRITKMSLDGKVLGRFGSPGTELDQFKTPWGIAVSPSGSVYVADTGNRRVIKLTP